MFILLNLDIKKIPHIQSSQHRHSKMQLNDFVREDILKIFSLNVAI